QRHPGAVGDHAAHRRHDDLPDLVLPGQADVRRAGPDLQEPDPPGQHDQQRANDHGQRDQAPPGHRGHRAPPLGPLPRQEPWRVVPRAQTGSSRRHLLKPSWRAGTRPPKPNRRGARTRPLKPLGLEKAPLRVRARGSRPRPPKPRLRPNPRVGTRPTRSPPSGLAGLSTRAALPPLVSARADRPRAGSRPRFAGSGPFPLLSARADRPRGGTGRRLTGSGPVPLVSPRADSPLGGLTLRRGGIAVFPPLLKARADSPRGAMVRGAGTGRPASAAADPGAGCPAPPGCRPTCSRRAGIGLAGRRDGVAAERRPAAEPPGSVAPLSRSRGARAGGGAASPP